MDVASLATSDPNAHCIGANRVPQRHIWRRLRRVIQQRITLKRRDRRETLLSYKSSRKTTLLESNPYLDDSVEGEGGQGIPYEWDDELDMLAHDEAPSVKMGAIRISNWRCGGEESDAVTRHENFNSNGCARHDITQHIGKHYSIEYNARLSYQ